MQEAGTESRADHPALRASNYNQALVKVGTHLQMHLC